MTMALYGSLQNRMMEQGVKGQPTPEVNMGATVLAYTDRYAATIIGIQVNQGRITLTVQEDEAKVVKGTTMDGSAEYEYHRNANGTKRTFRQDGKGRWREVQDGRMTKIGSGLGLRIGDRLHYHDPHF